MNLRAAPRPRLRRAVLPVLAALLAVVALPGCSNEPDRPHVVVTTNILGDITRRIVGDEARVQVLMKPNADPHSFGLSATDAASLEQADLVVFNGLGLEENVLRHVDNARESGVPTLEVGAGVDPLAYGAGQGESGQQDPHFWTDPDRVRKATGLIADEVTAHVDGADDRTVRRNAERYRKELSTLTTWMTESFARIPPGRRALVTNHHVFGYLAERFGFRVVGAVIPSGTTLASPSSSDLRSLTRAMDKAGVRTIFADSSRPQKLADVLRKEMGGDVRVVELYSESLTGKGGGADTYLAMMRANTRAMAEGLTA
ncbi:Manganese ABC transporter substrate-binding lipoprotein precursor [Streptomyces sp. YIM 130001]|uniref:zinc ABC transporter substrate-binding protein AztC n=1 Tax=Streptomyces sp. YIM 130001 TaxID=2259644 RepID=UPI000E6585A6|nr:zinc ABC transporter substrate-binding protein AztC [Streptomyces sp. YIM 130001]RII20633.1 Manganese ABC transporter substrate-binding lipoprotein precursor [Streptomyces sp. YIM 130001]